MFAHGDHCHTKARVSAATKPSTDPTSMKAKTPRAISVAAPTAATPETPEGGPEQGEPRRDASCLAHIDGDLARIHVHHRDRYAHAGPSVATIHHSDAIAWPDGDPKIDGAFLPFVPVIALDGEGQVIRGRDGGGCRRRPRLPAVRVDVRYFGRRRDVGPAMALNVHRIAGSQEQIKVVRRDDSGQRRGTCPLTPSATH